ncbi:Peptidyl-prolyl cis-trans isomerase PpiA precursor [hydrothermal vent metagenome]|uniref:peptidylprolyl isomerase n=1 Tax=hydrothermal vent metagenome TaxID=652676 RepID=A0A3B0SNQ4_9ZZZZ
MAMLVIVSTIVAVRAENIRVVMETSAGNIELELYADAAPVTVGNFLKYVDSKYYDNGKFYRVVRMDNQAQNKIKIEVIQGGRGMKTSQNSFAPIRHETTMETGILHKDGVISMARDKPGSATSEFFICINDQPALDFGGKRQPDGQGFAAFGKVISGMNIIRKIQMVKTDQPVANILEFTSGQMITDPVDIYHINRISD